MLNDSKSNDEKDKEILSLKHKIKSKNKEIKLLKSKLKESKETISELLRCFRR